MSTALLLRAPLDRRAAADAADPFVSFWMGGYEGADHLNAHGIALDMADANRHIEQIDEDHRHAAALGIRTVRESIGWRLAEPLSGCFDFERALRIAASAKRHGLQVLWTLMHYGTPPDLSLFDDALGDRFARFAAAAARALARYHERPPVYNLINEIGFLAWAASESDLIHPYRRAATDQPASSVASGFALKRRLVQATLGALHAVRQVDPRARFLHIEPVVHVVAPPDRPELEPLAEQVSAYQWQAWDMIAGLAEPQLGGSAAALDLIGVNHYHAGQWEVGSEARLEWHARDRRRVPLSRLLQHTWSRYRRPLILAETSHVGAGRASWLHEMAAEVARARSAGVPVQGVCLYPLIDRPDWNDPGHWHRSGLWDVAVGSAGGTPAVASNGVAPNDDGAAVGPAFDAPARAARDTRAAGSPGATLRRVLCTEYAAALAAWQRVLPLHAPAPLVTLIVFSHLRWDFVVQRPQQLMTRLARHCRVLFVEEPLHDAGAAWLDRRPHGPNLDVLVPHTPLDAAGFADAQLALVGPLLRDHLRREPPAGNAARSIAWYYTPLAWPLRAALPPGVVVYDCMDELAAFDNAPPALAQREAELLDGADLVMTRGPSLYTTRRARHPNVHCVPSGVDAAYFDMSQRDPDEPEAQHARALQPHLAGPRLGFFGVIDERFDLDLLRALADGRPQWQLIMAGPVVKIDPATLPQRANIHWLGFQPHARLPALVADWDVCLMPFALNAATRFISPTKTLEYLAAGKPVVCTPIADVITLYGAVLRIAAPGPAFIAACEAALAESDTERAARQAAARACVHAASWERTAGRVLRLLQAELATAQRSTWRAA